MRTLIFSAVAAILAAGSVGAAQVTVQSYDMLNGTTGSYNYWDESYDGVGNTMVNFAPLSGGTGDLTDGYIETQNWNPVEAPAGPGPYVGWTINPTITFNFAAVHNFTKVIFHFDDSNGSGGVSAPSTVTVAGNTTVIPEPPGVAPFAVEIPVALMTDTIITSFTRKNAWVFLSEVEFFDDKQDMPAIPLPAGGVLLVSALAGFGALRRRKS